MSQCKTCLLTLLFWKTLGPMVPPFKAVTSLGNIYGYYHNLACESAMRTKSDYFSLFSFYSIQKVAGKFPAIQISLIFMIET